MQAKLHQAISLAALLAAAFMLRQMMLPSSDALPSPETTVLFGQGIEPLPNVPEIGKPVRADRLILVPVTNRGSTTLCFYGTDTGYIQQINEIAQFGEWHYSWHDWCGTGKEDQYIKPSQTVTVSFNEWSEPKHERSLAAFSEVGTNRKGVVVLASE